MVFVSLFPASKSRKHVFKVPERQDAAAPAQADMEELLSTINQIRGSTKSDIIPEPDAPLPAANKPAVHVEIKRGSSTSQKAQAPSEKHADSELANMASETLVLRTKMAQGVYKTLFQTRPATTDRFLPKRTGFLFDVSDASKTDLPSLIVRGRAEVQPQVFGAPILEVVGP